MTLPVVWLNEAADELHEAVSWYTAVRPGLGARFAGKVIETVERLAENPLLYAVVDKNRRRAGVHQFPYGLFYIVEPKRIVIIACFHGKRDPQHWRIRS